VPRAVNRCPDCGEPVSQFAAGCALCGANLIAARRRQEERNQTLSTLRLERPSWLPYMSGGEIFLAALLLIIAFSVPVVGFFIAGLIAFFAHINDETNQRNIALAAVALALIVIILVSFVPGTELLPSWTSFSGPFPN